MRWHARDVGSPKPTSEEPVACGAGGGDQIRTGSGNEAKESTGGYDASFTEEVDA